MHSDIPLCRHIVFRQLCSTEVFQHSSDDRLLPKCVVLHITCTVCKHTIRLHTGHSQDSRDRASQWDYGWTCFIQPNGTDVPINPRHGPSRKNAPRCMIKEDKWLWRAVLSRPLIQRDGWVKPLSPRLHQYVPLCLTCSLALSLFPRCSFRLLTHSELVELKPHAFIPVLPLPGHSTKAGAICLPTCVRNVLNNEYLMELL